MTPTQILHTVYLCIIAGIVILGVVILGIVHRDGVNDGKADCRKQIATALEQQHIKDAKTSQDVIDELNQDKRELQTELAKHPPVRIIHDCSRVLDAANPVRPSPGPGRAASGEPAQPAADSSVPKGSGGGDVGPGVRAIATAGRLNAIYYARLYEWAMKTR